MRAKNEIIGGLFDDLKTAQSLGEIKSATEIPTLEVLIDIRDMLKEMNNCLVNIYTELPSID